MNKSFKNIYKKKTFSFCFDDLVLPSYLVKNNNNNMSAVMHVNKCTQCQRNRLKNTKVRLNGVHTLMTYYMT
jgi:hypothetical protein